MTIALDKLLAVKAFVLGSEASNSASRDVAARMISAAIDALMSSEDERDRVRLAFYHLLRSEMLRRGGEPVPDRNAALSEAEERFLTHITLKDMLEKHAIPYAP